MVSKTPEEMAEEYADDWHKDCDYPEEILRHTKKATASVFLAGYKAGQEHPFQFQTKMWVDPMGPQNRWISVKDRLPKEDGPILMWSGRLEDVPTCAAAGYELWNWSTEYSPHDYRLFELSHWMPLPKLPEDK